MISTVLVLGASGFIGRHLVETLARDGHLVIAATRRQASFDHPLVENVVSNFTECTDFLPLVRRSNTIIHAASQSTPSSSLAQPQLDGNLRTTLALIEALQEFPDRKLLYLSSGGSLYGDSQRALDEQAPLRPRSYHAAGKIAAEFFIGAWAAQYDGTAVVMRPSNVYGPGQLPKDGFGIIPTAFDRSMRSAALTVLGDGATLRDYLYIDDLSRLCTHALARELPRGTHVCNAASGVGLALNALLDAIDRTTRRPLQREYRPARRVDVRHILLDNTTASTMFGWSPEVSLDEGLRRTWQWFSTRP